MKKILEASSTYLWEHDGRYCMQDILLGEPSADNFCLTEKDIIRWAVRYYPLVTHFHDLDVAILDYFGEDRVTMVMLEQL